MKSETSTRTHVVNLLSGKTGPEAVVPKPLSKHDFWALMVPILLRNVYDNLSSTEVRILLYVLCADTDANATFRGGERVKMMKACKVSTALVAKAKRKFTTFGILETDEDFDDVKLNPALFGKLKRGIDLQAARQSTDVLRFVIPVTLTEDE